VPCDNVPGRLMLLGSRPIQLVSASKSNVRVTAHLAPPGQSGPSIRA
jgi:hypothetical protein